ncbi:enoyl-CoA hydratase [Mycolicibacterium septicum DSM 44393]|uniref:Enoyl-CoA hydratase n=1 Tax=Mycolicibacterium septicum DSM 44393 TaxID=1341646 RepID=A0A7X6MM77_9MYCO|nr:enoyl-CoA hydratase [Mycolicibacterium septicum]NKZ11372.1 enoyl-CoA hydratase [Mycolicibacterium septicum DSM 44393]
MNLPDLQIHDDDGVRILTIDRPAAKNALNGPLRSALRDALGDADRDDSVRAVVLTGIDPVFSAGVDFKQLERGPGESGGPLDITPAMALRAMRTPTICAVNGACVSGALEVALSCSFIIASDRARFADTHALLGVIPTWGLTALLPRAVGVRKARQMSITGEFVDAHEALRLGLVNQVVHHDDLLRTVMAIAHRIPANAAVPEMLGLYARGEDLSLAGALAAETAHSVGRRYDLAAFTASGSATAARQRTPESNR